MKSFRQQALAVALAVGAAVLWTVPVASVSAQPRGAPPPPRSARESAPIDLTGQWVAIVTEDWRFRMVTPPKGDHPGVALTPAGTAIAMAWDPAKDEAAGNACKAYGAAAIMRVPGRIRISWQDDSTLEIQTDAGRQVRTLHFGNVADPAEPALQGVSRAEWVTYRGGFGPPRLGRSLKVVTTHMQEGYLRKNGVPYSGATVMTEYFDILAQPDGSQWLVVKSIVEDPGYLAAPAITSSNFRQQTDRSGWDPQACSVR